MPSSLDEEAPAGRCVSPMRAPRPLLLALMAISPLAIFAGTPACNRAPEEPAPVASTRAAEARGDGDNGGATRAAANDRAHANAGRCIKPSPREAPAAAPAPVPSACPNDPERIAGLAPLDEALVHFDEATSGPVDVRAEVARSDHDSERGLMYRTSMPEDHGMLFDLPERIDHTFWMHNTCLSLDLLYIDTDGLIVGIAENAPTLSDQTISVGCPSHRVLEVNAGWTRRHGVFAGQRVRLP